MYVCMYVHTQNDGFQHLKSSVACTRAVSPFQHKFYCIRTRQLKVFFEAKPSSPSKLKHATLPVTKNYKFCFLLHSSLIKGREKEGSGKRKEEKGKKKNKIK